MDKFKLHSSYKPMGDQPEAIKKLADGIEDGVSDQVLLGVTGSGKTFTMANIIERVNRPALVIAHNKTLASQLCSELKEFFPENRVEYFVSYYDYYQPESYIVATDTYIEKDSSVNDEIDKLRHAATASLGSRRDVIVVASVSCIYGLGAPEEYYKQTIYLREGEEYGRNKLMHRLIEVQYKRNDIDFTRSTFRVRGDTIDIFPSNATENAIRVEFFGDTIESIGEFSVASGKIITRLKETPIMPASHFVQDREKINAVTQQILADLDVRLAELEGEGKMLEAFRLKQRVNYDVEMIREIGFCSGIENYSRYFDGRAPGEPPYTLIDYFPDDFIMFIDESHITLPQIRGMFNGDKARKENLVDYGFRLPSAKDNRPLNFSEFRKRQPQTIYISATPNDYELGLAKDNVAEQIIRPTGLLDPRVEVRPIKNQMDDLIAEIYDVTQKGGRVLVTTLTKKMTETLSTYFAENKVKAKYLHSDIDTLERIDIITSLRKGEFDVLVGINLLREGLDIPEVSLVAILDADKEGFLRSRTSLIQIIGRAARNANAKVIMYADVMTDSMKAAISETERRRKIQEDFNKAHGITPKTIVKPINENIRLTKKVGDQIKKLSKKEINAEIEELKALMTLASKNLDFEQAINLREQITELKKHLRE